LTREAFFVYIIFAYNHLQKFKCHSGTSLIFGLPSEDPNTEIEYDRHYPRLQYAGKLAF